MKVEGVVCTTEALNIPKATANTNICLQILVQRFEAFLSFTIKNFAKSMSGKGSSKKVEINQDFCHKGGGGVSNVIPFFLPQKTGKIKARISTFSNRGN